MTISREQAQKLLDGATGPITAEGKAEKLNWDEFWCWRIMAGDDEAIWPGSEGDLNVSGSAFALFAAAPDLARTVMEQADQLARVRSLAQHWQQYGSLDELAVAKLLTDILDAS